MSFFMMMVFPSPFTCRLACYRVVIMIIIITRIIKRLAGLAHGWIISPRSVDRIDPSRYEPHRPAVYAWVGDRSEAGHRSRTPENGNDSSKTHLTNSKRSVRWGHGILHSPRERGRSQGIFRGPYPIPR